MSFLSLLLCLEAHLVYVIFQALGLKFQFVVFSLEDSLCSTFFLDFLSMLNQKVILFHFGKISLLSHLNQLSMEVRDAPFPFVNIAAQFTDLLLISALFYLKMQRMVLFA